MTVVHRQVRTAFGKWLNNVEYPDAFHHWDVENTWDPEGTPETYHDHYMTVTEVTGGDI